MTTEYSSEERKRAAEQVYSNPIWNHPRAFAIELQCHLNRALDLLREVSESPARNAVIASHGLGYFKAVDELIGGEK